MKFIYIFLGLVVSMCDLTHATTPDHELDNFLGDLQSFEPSPSLTDETTVCVDSLRAYSSIPPRNPRLDAILSYGEEYVPSQGLPTFLSYSQPEDITWKIDSNIRSLLFKSPATRTFEFALHAYNLSRKQFRELLTFIRHMKRPSHNKVHILRFGYRSAQNATEGIHMGLGVISLRATQRTFLDLVALDEFSRLSLQSQSPFALRNNLRQISPEPRVNSRRSIPVPAAVNNEILE